jgi:hypothetical protein
VANSKLFWEDGGLKLFDAAGVFVELHLDDLIEAAIDGGEAVKHLFAEAADLIVHVGAKVANVCTDFRDFSPDVLAFALDETRKLVEFGFLFGCHVGQYTMPLGRP